MQWLLVRDGSIDIEPVSSPQYEETSGNSTCSWSSRLSAKSVEAIAPHVVSGTPVLAAVMAFHFMRN